MHTSELAAASGYSAQQIRQLETRGVIPAAVREENGYRRFSAEHLQALIAYRDLASAVGPVAARTTMSALFGISPAEAVAKISNLVVGLEAERRQALSARAALVAIHGEADIDADINAEEAMTITELSKALGIRPSTLRFWESEDLVCPDRVEIRSGSARLCRTRAVRDARVTAALRAGGYRIPEVRQALSALRELGETDSTLRALDDRLAELARRGLALLRAGGLLAELIGEELLRGQLSPRGGGVR